MKTGFKHIVFVIVLFLVFLRGTAQEPVFNVNANGQSLAEVLERLADDHEIRFAFDPETFGKTEASFSLENVSLSHFLNFLESRFGVTSKEIDGTWILILPEKQKAEPPPPPEPEPALVSGYIKDKNTGENLIYCNVASENHRGGMTNELGFFSFSIPAKDSVRLMVSYLGYHKIDTLVSTRNTSVIYLEPSEIMLKPIRVVHTEREVLQASPQAEKIAFNPLKSHNVPRISNDDMGNALLLIPGINFLQGGSSGLSIRGGAPTDNLVLFDGIPVLETSHLLGNISVMNAKFVQQAFVSRGGFDAGYGGRVSGLIELTGKSGKQNRPYIDLSANLLNTNALVNLPVGNKFSVTAAWRRSFVDSWQNYLYYRLIDNVTSTEQNPVTSTIIPMVKYQDVNAKMSFHPSDNLEFNLNLLYGSDRQSRDFELIQTKDYYRNESMDSENLGMSFNLKWQVNNQWYHSFSAGFSGLEKNAVDETGELKEFNEVIENPGKGKGIGLGLAKTRERTFTRLTYDNDNGYNNIEEYLANWKTEFNTGAFRNEAGAGWTFNRFNYNFVASRSQETVKIDSISSKSELNMLSAFFQQHITLAEDFRFRWGLRTSFDVSRKNVYWQPRGGLEILPSPGLKFYFLSGMYYQFLTGIRRFDSEGHYSQIWYLPVDDGKGIVHGSHYVLGGKFEKNGWFIDVEAYNKNTQGKLHFFAETISSGNEETANYIPRESREKNRGIDFFIQKKHFLFNHMLSYSYSVAEEQTDGFFDNDWYPGLNDRTHRLKFTEMLTWRNWTLTGSCHLATGLPVFQLTQDAGQVEFMRSEPFAQTDLALVKSFKAKFYSASAGVSLLNVFDRSNIVEVNYLRFSSDSGSLTVRSDISALGFTPVFFMNFRF